VQLFGLALIGFGIFWEIKDWNYFNLPNYVPHLGLLVVIVGMFLDPILDSILDATVLRRLAQILSRREKKGV
jgi:hypothetical protein